MNESADELTKRVSDMLAGGATAEDIALELYKKGYDHFQADAIIEQCRRLLAARKRTTGLALVLAGALICLVSCIVTLFSDSAAFTNYTLIGATSVGVIVIFAGLMMIF